jgi:ubiquinone/menaquinone biosynthesis C-methylase UbiE/predicted transcriptional regulator
LKNWDEILGMAREFMQSRVILSAVELDLFTVIGEEELNAKEITSRTNLDLRAVEILLDALAAMELLHKKDEHYSNTPVTAKFLNAASPENAIGQLQHTANLWKSWSQLTQIVQTGKLPPHERDEASGRSFILAMYHNAVETSKLLAQAIDLTGIHRMLDMGGGPGAYAMAFCDKSHGLRAAIYDLPYALEVAKEMVAHRGLSDRIDLIPGDFLQDPVPNSFDLVLVSHVLHSYGEKDCRTILEKAVGALNPGGKLIVHDFLMEPNRIYPPWAAIFSINMLVNTPEGRSYTADEILGWMTEAGVNSIQKIQLTSGSSALIGQL